MTVGTCTALIRNRTGDTLVYDYWDLAVTMDRLNGDCVRNNLATAVCLFGGSIENRAWIMFVVLLYLLTSETQPAFPSSLGHSDTFALSQ